MNRLCVLYVLCFGWLVCAAAGFALNPCRPATP